MEEYTTKEILLSVKDKLCELNSKLDQLKELTTISDSKKIIDIKYYLENYCSYENPEIFCSISKKDNVLKNRIRKYLIPLYSYSLGVDDGVVVKDNNGKCYVLNHNKDIFITSENQEKFNIISDEIVNDEFSRDFLRNHWLYPAKHGLNQSMSIFPNEVSIRGMFDNNISAFFNYSPSNNTAKLSTVKGHELSDEILKELLNIHITDYYITDYRRKLLESPDSKNKKIIIPSFRVNDNEVNFDIKEDNKKLYLIKK